MTRYRALLTYDGTAYQGFQRQAGDSPTIQGAVESAIAAATGQAATVIGAGRTDTGVHATGQVIAFDVEWQHEDAALLRALNALLPGDIALQDLTRHEGFHPRFDAVLRIYKYTLIVARQRQPLLRHRAWWVHHPLDGDAMQRAASLLVGEHDFATFGKPPQGQSTVRRVETSEWVQALPTADQPQPFEQWTYTIAANAFLQHMVRRIVGALVFVGRGKWSVEQFRTAFERARLLEAITLAPPQGLVLAQVLYPDEGTQDQEQAGETPAGGRVHG
jgi:tRNA pseudouridine38-40 synthase